MTQRLGTGLMDFIAAAGQQLFLAFDVLRSLFRYRLRWALLAQQIQFIGTQSILVVVITGAFTGAVFAAQIQFQFADLGMNSAVGPVVSLAMCRELGAVLCALMVAGRVGSAMAAELSTMKITEQIDALRALAVYPTEYLLVPRVLGMAIAMPVLTALCIFFGIAAGYFVFTTILGLDGAYYWENTLYFTKAKDVLIGLIKGLFFGIIIAVVSCHKGMTSGGGAAGVGVATTQAVVNASLLILITNFFFTFLLNTLFS